MDLTLNYLMSSFQIETLSFGTVSGGVLNSFSRGAETEEEEGGNEIPSYIFSNLATKMIYDMLANGAEGDQQTTLLQHSHGKPLHRLNQIVPKTLEFLTETGNAGGPMINLSLCIWYHSAVQLNSNYQKTIETYFKPKFQTFGISITELEALKNEVNKWVELNTGGLIINSLGSTNIGADTRLILASALQFEGKWFAPFEDAGDREFTFLDGQVGSLPFMTTNEMHYIQQFTGFKLLSVPFKQHPASRFSMLFYLPDDPERFEDLRLLIGVEEAVIQDVYFPEESVHVGDFLIPKFRLDLRGPQALMYTDNDGINSLFTFPQMADSPANLISRGGRLTSCLEIDETGVRAAGASYFFVEETPPTRIVPPSTIQPFSDFNIDFIANRPFLFFIRDNQFGRMLFAGALINPVDQSPSFKPIGV